MIFMRKAPAVGRGFLAEFDHDGDVVGSLLPAAAVLEHLRPCQPAE